MEDFGVKSFGSKSGEQNKTFAILALVYKKVLSLNGVKIWRAGASRHGQDVLRKVIMRFPTLPPILTSLMSTSTSGPKMSAKPN